MQKLMIAAVATSFAANMAYAADASCEAKAVSKDGKSLAGAAKASFIKKCEKESEGASGANSACEAKAVSKEGKPLHGAAKTAAVKKCMAETK